MEGNGVMAASRGAYRRFLAAALCLELMAAGCLRGAAAQWRSLTGGGSGMGADRGRSPVGGRRRRARRAAGKGKPAAGAMRLLATEASGQGTTEYAILVGVLVLMAIVAVVAMRDNLQKLWTSITDGINSL